VSATTTLPKNRAEMIDDLEGQLRDAREHRRSAKRLLQDAEKHEQRIAKALKQLRGSGRRRAPRQTSDLDPHTQAGEANLDKARAALKKLPTTFTMAELGRESGVGTGTLTWACRALEADGVIQATGNVGPRRSREYRVTAKARRMRPGS
jgi:hypothetical protein